MQAVACEDTKMSQLKKEYPPPPPGYKRVFSRIIRKNGKVIRHPRGGVFTWLEPCDTII